MLMYVCVTYTVLQTVIVNDYAEINSAINALKPYVSTISLNHILAMQVASYMWAYKHPPMISLSCTHVLYYVYTCNIHTTHVPHNE